MQIRIGMPAARVRRPLSTALILICGLMLALSDIGPASQTATAQFPASDATTTDESATKISRQPPRVDGDRIAKWNRGGADISWLRDNCRLMFEDRIYLCDQVLLVVDGPPGRVRTRFVISGVSDGKGGQTGPLSGVIYSALEPQIQSPTPVPVPQSLPALASHLPGGWPDVRLPHPQSTPGDLRLAGHTESPAEDSGADDGGVRQAQYASPLPVPDSLPDQIFGPTLVPPPATSFPGTPGVGTPVPNQTTMPDAPRIQNGEGQFRIFSADGRHEIEFVSRNPAAPLSIQNVPRPALGEEVWVARGGATVLIRDVQAQLPGGQFLDLGTISLSAHRIVAWTPLLNDLMQGRADMTSHDLELYLEGDIVFRQGDRIIYAESMYYNVTQETGMVLDAEAISTIPDYQGVVRLKADVLQQVAEGNFQAFGAAVTTSRLGVPRYWLQSDQLSFRQRLRTTVDPITNQTIQATDSYVSSRDNFIYFGGVPVFYWPRLSASIRKPPLYLTGANFKNDDIFGTQVMLEWDLFQLLGYDSAPDGVDVRIKTDYLSDRGPAFGTRTTYDRTSFFGIPGHVRGQTDGYLIHDTGLDTLGQDRRDLTPEKTWRGKSWLQHRHTFNSGWEFIAEVGYISDRNFLEQYFESDWDQQKDYTTGARLRRYGGNQLLDLSVEARVNDFFKETQQLPVLEHYAIGLSPLGNALTWTMNNKVGYVDLNVADTPVDPVEAASMTTLPGEVDAKGLIASTRHELSAPLDLGPLNLSPFVGGDATYFGEDINGDSLTRLTGQAGIRASLPMYRIDPTIQSALLNVRGLAHKIEWVGEYFYADSDANFDDLPYYDSLDDNAQEQFRRRFIIDQFGGVLPAQFDPRDYGFRQGIQRYVTSPSDVVVADQQQIRLGVHQRFQTRRGLPGRERITDILRLDIDTILMPDADRDNYGETVGPTTYDASFHLGDRVSLLSDGYIDFFDDGLRSISGGIRMSRPGLGDVYAGLINIDGPVTSTALRTSLDYRLNEKWIVRAGSTYDFADVGNVGQTIGLTRIGESFLTGFEVTVDAGRENVGFNFFVLPRFFPTGRGRVGGQLIPPPGVEGLE
ncbi:LPS-assembly protein LptD [Crateriforma conspicua]|nr:LPS-assembly protein LptD [Crateriforma conspicua]